MSTAEIQSWLQASIAAVKAGESEKAHTLLMKVIEADERNEQAWLWLSSVVETDEERIICLENVLTINPDNAAAQIGLAKLGVEPSAAVPLSQEEMAEEDANTAVSDTPPEERIVVRRERTPVSLASAVLYPNKQVKEWSWQEPALKQRKPEATIQGTSKFKDVWSDEEIEMCAYCACPLAYEDKQCPRCKRRLISKPYRYPQPSRNMYVFFVLLINQSQLFFAQAIYDIIVNKRFIASNIGWPIAFMLAFFVLAMGVYFRQFWAHLGAIILLSLILFIIITSVLAPIDFTALKLPVMDPAMDSFLDSLGNLISTTIKLFQIATVVIALIYAIFKTGPDFDRIHIRQTAAVTKGLKAASEYNIRAKELARKGMWASAILHWQHASGKEPHIIPYQRHLGLAYAQLGFYERSLDILQSALNLSTNPQMQANLKQIIQTVHNMQSKSQK